MRDDDLNAARGCVFAVLSSLALLVLVALCYGIAR